MKKPILLLYLGRNGAMARFFVDIVQSVSMLVESSDIYFLRSKQISIPMQKEWEQGRSLVLSTYHSMLTCLLSLLRMPWVMVRVIWFCRKHRIASICSIGGHPWHFFLLPLFSLMRIPHKMCVHDGKLHPGENSWIRRCLLQVQIAFSQSFVTFSLAAKEDLLLSAKYGIGEVVTLPLPNMVYSEAPTLRYYPSSSRFSLLFLGRILPYKGLEILLESYAMLKPDHPQLELCIAGQGDIEPYRKWLHLPGIHLVHRWIQEEEIAGFLAAADAAVASYTEASQSGLVALAHGAGLPVIVTPTGGLKEQVEDGVTGIIAKHTDAQSFAEAIRCLLHHPDRYEAMSSAILAAHHERSTLAFVEKLIRL